MSSLECVVVGVRGLSQRTDSAGVVQCRPARVQLVEAAAGKSA